jgi:RNA polymerase sigma factor (sigma-70 family)
MTQLIDEVNVQDAVQAGDANPRGWVGDAVRDEAACEAQAAAAQSALGGATSRPECAGDEDLRAAVFDIERGRLLALAARVLGSRAEAEDVVQDAWFRWREADTEAVRAPKAWLATVTVRLAIDRLRKLRRESEGERNAPWLDETAPSAEEMGLRAALLSEGLLMLLERLGPLEQAVFVLREAFDCDYAEVAALTGCTPAHCRQIVHRARGRLARGQALHAEPAAPTDAGQHALTVERLREVLHAQDRIGLLDLLGVTATALAVASAAAPRVQIGAQLGAACTPVRRLRAEMLALDGEPGVALVAENGELAAWLHVRVAEDGRSEPVVRVASSAAAPDLLAASHGGEAVRALLAQFTRPVAEGGAAAVAMRAMHAMQVTRASASVATSFATSTADTAQTMLSRSPVPA